MSDPLATFKVEPIGQHHVVMMHAPYEGVAPTYALESQQRGERFRDARRAAGFTLGEAGRRLGKSVVWISDIERGRRWFTDEEAALKQLDELGMFLLSAPVERERKSLDLDALSVMTAAEDEFERRHEAALAAHDAEWIHGLDTEGT